MWRGCVVAVASVLAWFQVHSVVMVADGLRDDAGRSDVAVVFGNRVEPSGRPGRTLRARLDRAARLWRRGGARTILVSGGFGREGHEEALVMREALLTRGVPAAAIVVDATGYDTRATALATARLARTHGWRSATVVTSYWHVPRAKLAMRRAGITEVRGVGARSRFDLRDAYSIGREFPAYYLYAARVR